MSRIDIEGALPPLRERGYPGEPAHWHDKKQRQQFARYFSSPLPQISNMSIIVGEYADNSLKQSHYRIVSGPLYGMCVSVSIAANGLHIVLSHTDGQLIERVQRIRQRWQRQLHQLGFPCLLEVTHVGGPYA